MRDIVTLRYGLHLFGTATPASDIGLTSIATATRGVEEGDEDVDSSR